MKTFNDPSDGNVYRRLNDDMREHRHHTEECKAIVFDAWHPMVHSLLTGPQELPAMAGDVWRGITANLEKLRGDYKPSSTVSWSAFTSTTTSLDSAFLLGAASLDQAGLSVVVFKIAAVSLRDVRHYSVFGHEQELLLLPYTEFVVVRLFKVFPEAAGPDGCLCVELVERQMTDVYES